MSEVPAQYYVMPEQSHAAQLADRCRRLERELRETRAALVAAEARENDLIDRIRGKGGL
jgi:hypothetical protein